MESACKCTCKEYSIPEIDKSDELTKEQLVSILEQQNKKLNSDSINTILFQIQNRYKPIIFFVTKYIPYVATLYEVEKYVISLNIKDEIDSTKEFFCPYRINGKSILPSIKRSIQYRWKITTDSNEEIEPIKYKSCIYTPNCEHEKRHQNVWIYSCVCWELLEILRMQLQHQTVDVRKNTVRLLNSQCSSSIIVRVQWVLNIDIQLERLQQMEVLHTNTTTMVVSNTNTLKKVSNVPTITTTSNTANTLSEKDTIQLMQKYVATLWPQLFPQSLCYIIIRITHIDTDNVTDRETNIIVQSIQIELLENTPQIVVLYGCIPLFIQSLQYQYTYEYHYRICQGLLKIFTMPYIRNFIHSTDISSIFRIYINWTALRIQQYNNQINTGITIKDTISLQCTHRIIITLLRDFSGIFFQHTIHKECSDIKMQISLQKSNSNIQYPILLLFIEQLRFSRNIDIYDTNTIDLLKNIQVFIQLILLDNNLQFELFQILLYTNSITERYDLLICKDLIYEIISQCSEFFPYICFQEILQSLCIYDSTTTTATACSITTTNTTTNNNNNNLLIKSPWCEWNKRHIIKVDTIKLNDIYKTNLQSQKLYNQQSSVAYSTISKNFDDISVINKRKLKVSSVSGSVQSSSSLSLPLSSLSSVSSYNNTISREFESQLTISKLQKFSELFRKYLLEYVHYLSSSTKQNIPIKLQYRLFNYKSIEQKQLQNSIPQQRINIQHLENLWYQEQENIKTSVKSTVNEVLSSPPSKFSELSESSVTYNNNKNNENNNTVNKKNINTSVRDSNNNTIIRGNDISDTNIYWKKQSTLGILYDTDYNTCNEFTIQYTSCSINIYQRQVQYRQQNDEMSILLNTREEQLKAIDLTKVTNKQYIPSQWNWKQLEDILRKQQSIDISLLISIEEISNRFFSILLEYTLSKDFYTLVWNQTNLQKCRVINILYRVCQRISENRPCNIFLITIDTIILQQQKDQNNLYRSSALINSYINPLNNISLLYMKLDTTLKDIPIEISNIGGSGTFLYTDIPQILTNKNYISDNLLDSQNVDVSSKLPIYRGISSDTIETSSTFISINNNNSNTVTNVNALDNNNNTIDNNNNNTVDNNNNNTVDNNNNAVDNSTNTMTQNTKQIKNINESIKYSIENIDNPFENEQQKYTQSRLYIQIIGQLSDSPHGRTILNKYDVYTIQKPLSKFPNKDYLTRQLLYEQKYIDICEQNLLEVWLEEGSQSIKRTILQVLRYQCINDTFIYWIIKQLVVILKQYGDLQIRLGSLSLLYDQCKYDSKYLRYLIEQRPDQILFGGFSYDLQMLIIQDEDGQRWCLEVGYIQSILYTMGRYGNQKYVENQELNLKNSQLNDQWVTTNNTINNNNIINEEDNYDYIQNKYTLKDDTNTNIPLNTKRIQYHQQCRVPWIVDISQRTDDTILRQQVDSYITTGYGDSGKNKKPCHYIVSTQLDAENNPNPFPIPKNANIYCYISCDTMNINEMENIKDIKFICTENDRRYNLRKSYHNCDILTYVKALHLYENHKYKEQLNIYKLNTQINCICRNILKINKDIQYPCLSKQYIEYDEFSYVVEYENGVKFYFVNNKNNLYKINKDGTTTTTDSNNEEELYQQLSTIWIPLPEPQLFNTIYKPVELPIHPYSAILNTILGEKILCDIQTVYCIKENEYITSDTISSMLYILNLQFFSTLIQDFILCKNTLKNELININKYKNINTIIDNKIYPQTLEKQYFIWNTIDININYIPIHIISKNSNTTIYKWEYRQRTMQWNFGHIGCVERGQRLLLSTIIDNIDIVTYISKQAYYDTIYTLKSTAYYVLGQQSLTIYGQNILKNLGWETILYKQNYIKKNQSRGIVFPINIQEFLNSTNNITIDNNDNYITKINFLNNKNGLINVPHISLTNNHLHIRTDTNKIISPYTNTITRTYIEKQQREYNDIEYKIDKDVQDEILQEEWIYHWYYTISDIKKFHNILSEYIIPSLITTISPQEEFLQYVPEIIICYILGYISNLTNQVTQKVSLNILRRIKRFLPKIFISPYVFGRVLAFLSCGSIRLSVLRYIYFDLFRVRFNRVSMMFLGGALLAQSDNFLLSVHSN